MREDGLSLIPAGWHSHYWYLLKDQEYEFRRTRVSSGKWYCPISLSLKENQSC